MTETYKISDFTIDLDDYGRLVSSSKPGFVENMKKSLEEANGDDFLFMDDENGLWFHFFIDNYEYPNVHVFDPDKLSDKEKLMLNLLSYSTNNKDAL